METDFNYVIRKTIEYNVNGKKRAIEDLEAEKDKYIKLLNNWVDNLPINKNSNAK